MKKAIFFLLCGCCTITYAQKRQVCITIDDVPLVTYGNKDSIVELKMTQKLIHACVENNIPAIGYVNEIQFQWTSRRKYLLDIWLKSGLELGNHSFSHPSYNRVSYQEYTSDILKGETFLRPLMEVYGKQLKYYRHPYLHIGDSQERRDSLLSFLLQHHYEEAPVTIDNADYLFALKYQKANDKKDTIQMKQIGKDYLQYMENKIIYFEKVSKKVFKKEIPQTLMLHASLLNADFLSDLAKIFIKRGYEFVSQGEVLKAKEYQTPIKVFTTYGDSWLFRWGKSLGMNMKIIKKDPKVPDYIKQK